MSLTTERQALDFSLPAPGGRTLATMKSGRLSFVDTHTGHETPSSQRLDVGGSRWSPDGRRFMTFGPDEVIRVWDAGSGRLVAQRSHFTDSLPVAFSPDGTSLYVPDGTGSSRPWTPTR